MHSTGSVLRTIIERTRLLLHHPSADVHSDAYLLNNLAPVAFMELNQWLSMQQPDIPVLDLTISLEQGTEFYDLPPSVGSIVRLVKRSGDTSNLVTHDWKPRNEGHPDEVGWKLEGNTIRFRPIPDEDDTDWILTYKPTGHFSMQLGTGSLTDSDSITLASSPTLGQVERHINGLVGHYLRVIPSGSAPIQTRLITGYNAKTRVADLRLPFDVGADTGLNGSSPVSVTYEVVPFHSIALWHAIAAKVAMILAVPLEVSGSKMARLETEMHNARKAVLDLLTMRNERRPPRMEDRTLDRRTDELDLFLWQY